MEKNTGEIGTPKPDLKSDQPTQLGIGPTKNNPQRPAEPSTERRLGTQTPGPLEDTRGPVTVIRDIQAGPYPSKYRPRTPDQPPSVPAHRDRNAANTRTPTATSSGIKTAIALTLAGLAGSGAVLLVRAALLKHHGTPTETASPISVFVKKPADSSTAKPTVPKPYASTNAGEPLVYPALSANAPAVHPAPSATPPAASAKIDQIPDGGVSIDGGAAKFITPTPDAGIITKQATPKPSAPKPTINCDPNKGPIDAWDCPGLTGN